MKPASVVLTPDATTSINGGVPGAMTTIPGSTTALKANLANGNDVLNLLGDADFVMSGAATFDLGEGNDTLNLNTTGRISLGGLSVLGGEGDEVISVLGGFGKASTVGGSAKFDFGSGSGKLFLGGDYSGFGELAIFGGVQLKAAGGPESFDLEAELLTVGGAFTADIGNAKTEAHFADSNLASLAFRGTRELTAVLTNTPVTNSLTFKAVVANLTVKDATIGGSISVVAPFGTLLTATAVSIGGNVTLDAGDGLASGAALTTVNVKGNVFVKAGFLAQLIVGGVSSIGGSVTAKTGKAGNQALVSLTTTTVKGGVSAWSGLLAKAIVTSSTIGGSVAAGDGKNQQALVTITGSNVKGAVSGRSDLQAEVNIGTSTIGGNVTSDAGKGQQATVSITGSTVKGSVTIRSRTFADATLVNSSAEGSVTAYAGFRTIMQFTTATVKGNVAVKAGWESLLTSTGSSVGGNITMDVRKGNGAEARLDGTVVEGNIAVYGGVVAGLTSTGAASTVRQVTLTSGVEAGIRANGTSLTINGNLVVSSSVQANFIYGTTSLSEVKGNITFNGGTDGDTFQSNSQFKAARDLTLNLGANNELGDLTNHVTIGDTAAATAIGGNLAITGGVAADLIVLNRVNVAGSTRIATGSGDDSLSIKNGSTFAAFAADLAAGSDTISLAQNSGSTAPVTFNGKATLKAGRATTRCSWVKRRAGPAGTPTRRCCSRPAVRWTVALARRTSSTPRYLSSRV